MPQLKWLLIVNIFHHSLKIIRFRFWKDYLKYIYNIKIKSKQICIYYNIKTRKNKKIMILKDNYFI